MIRPFGLATMSLFCVALQSAIAAAGEPPPAAAPSGQPARMLGDPTKMKGPYDTEAESGKQIAEALKKAKRDHTRVLLQYGGNWCPKCIQLHKLMKDDEQISKTLLYEYQYVLIDYGQPPGKNMNLPKQYGADPHGEGVPYFTVLDSAGRMFANQPLTTYEKTSGGTPAPGAAVSYDAAAVLKFLKANKASPPTAQSVLDKGLAEARSSNRRVFLHFGAPWCSWCHRLDDWMARADVGALLGKDFVDVKIDTDRFPGGQAMFEKMAGDGKQGIPWYAILDPDSKVVADSFATGEAGKRENIGFPSQDPEIEAFGAMIAKGARSLTADDREKLLNTLREKPAKTEPGH